MGSKENPLPTMCSWNGSKSSFLEGTTYQGQVTHRSDGRVNIYRAEIQRERVSRSMVTDLAERLFAGDVTQMVCHLLEGCEAGREDLAQLKKLIRQKEQELRDAE